MQFDEGPHNRKAKSYAAMPRPGCRGFKPVENMFEDFGRNATPLVGNLEQNFVILPHRREIDGLTGRGKADRVREKVEENLPDTFAVGDK